MSATPFAASPPETATDEREALGARLFSAAVASAEMSTVYLGLTLGLYRALRDATGPLSAAELAARTGVDVRYAREWLEQQAVCGMLAADDAAGAHERRFTLPAAAAEVLTDEDSPFFGAGAPLLLAGVSLALPTLPEAFRTGTGVPYGAYGAEARVGIAAFNRPAFLHELGAVWLPSMPETHERLSSAPRARVLDLGCGTGASSVAIARAYPSVDVVGVDLDEASVAEARRRAVAEGLADRVTFRCSDAADLGADDPFDLVTVFEALHDMGDPVGALRAARALLRPGGRILVADERVAEEFTAPGDEVERLNYALSVLHCLPATRAEDAVEANGTVLRPATVRRWATDAGFSRVEEVDIDFPFWRFYALEG
jgi:ubiquinone/menaquinone biosynthesis C-methylase UbiE